MAVQEVGESQAPDELVTAVSTKGTSDPQLSLSANFATKVNGSSTTSRVPLGTTDSTGSIGVRSRSISGDAADVIGTPALPPTSFSGTIPIPAAAYTLGRSMTIIEVAPSRRWLPCRRTRRRHASSNCWMVITPPFPSGLPESLRYTSPAAVSIPVMTTSWSAPRSLPCPLES